jgi:hypothetical protein
MELTVHGLLFMLKNNEIGVSLSAESEFRRFLQALGATAADIDQGRCETFEWIFTCKSEADAKAIIVLFTE